MSAKYLGLTAAATLALGAGIALAQDAPESLLPPGFDDPAPTPTPTAQPTQAPATTDPAAPTVSGPVVQPIPSAPAIPSLGDIDMSSIPSIEELEAMSSDELDQLLGLTPSYDIPPAARRGMGQVGVIDASEGGLPTAGLARQPASLVRAILKGADGPLVSRWGHILMRRALASRLAAPDGMNPVEFAALRASSLNAMGEYAAARALVQDVDTGNWDEALTDAALEAYVATADIVGACPAVRLQGSREGDARWSMLQAICNAYAGEGTRASSQLDRALRSEDNERIDVLLAQRYAGAAGNGRRAVDIEWEEVSELNPWRFALANAVGEPLPDALLESAGPYYQRLWATGAMLPLDLRAEGADRAARDGIISSTAMVDLYSQIYADDRSEGEAAERAVTLRNAYVAASAAERLAAMQKVWGGDAANDYGRYVLTAFAAARFAPSEAYADAADALVASMLTAGLDRDAMTWASVVPAESAAGAMLALARPGTVVMQREAVDGFIDDDGSEDYRRSAFLLASLSALGRIDQEDLADFTDRIELDLGRQNAWTLMITKAAAVDNPTLVAMLAGLGMQGEGWDKMTPLHLYHIVSALNRVGLSAEARMIAAESIARG
ncbi:hypothetical protein HUO12_05170 [Altererythrobacter sp. JGD-16]|uniref:Antifreeze protein n=2 Tax=Altererythrobacter lutimaris TaxID=2743979 RepID=A0A850H554_9SPHN|nr:hypothetical protein [Altererythrobacter lutimaris]